MATPGGSDGAPESEYLQPSRTSSSSMFSSSSSSMSSSSFTSGDSTSTICSRATTTQLSSVTIRELEEITDNFSNKRLLGQGAYGKVYKGMRENGEEIAVKVLHNNMQAIDDEKFQHEFDNLIMLEHKHTIRLVGYCYETQRKHTAFEGRIVFGERTYKALCFEYMQMGSLQRHLSDETLGLDWQTRYKIIKGTCEGLKYLHEGFKEPIYHLDLKPDNILLDKNMVPKLADFGLSKLFGEEQTRVMQSFVGTIGYMPPEYLLGQVVSKKFDIFSLGVIITMIIAGPKGRTRSAEMPYEEFLDQVNRNWRNRMEATCTPQTLEANCEQVSICTEIGLRCMEMDRHKRPSILDITHILDVTETIVQKGTTLRRLLSNTTLDHNRIAKVPSSSCSVSSKIYWEINKKNEEHDIPSHQEALAGLFCRQTVDDALSSLDSREDYKILNSKESPRFFKEISDTLLERIIIMYDHETEKYDPKVRDKERQYMVDKLRKVFIEDSRELIRKMMRNASEQFKREYTKNIKTMEETDGELKYDDQMVDSCVEKFMNSCEDLKVFDSDYLHMKRGELQKQLHLYTFHHILTIKEIRVRKEVEKAQQRSHETAEELRKMLEQTTIEKQNAEADAERTRQNKKQIEEELEYTRQTLAKQQESILNEQREHMEKMLAAEQQARKAAADSDTVWEQFLPPDCDAILERAVHLVDYSSKKELFLDLAQEHILLDDGKMSFGLQRCYGAKCYMLSGSQLLDISWIRENIYWTRRSDPDSRFSKVAELLSVCWLRISGSINSRELSPGTHYAGYLVFKLTKDASGFSSPRQTSFVEVGGQLVGSDHTVSLHPCKHASCRLGVGGETSVPHEHKEEGGVMVRYPQQRVDNWLELEMGDFHTDTSYDATDVKMELREFEELGWKKGLIVEGIEIRPKN